MWIEEDLRSCHPVCSVLCRSSERSFQRNFCGRRYFFTVAIVDSVRSSRSGHSLQEIRLVKSIGIISRTVIGLVVSVVCKVKVKRYGYRPGVAQRVPGS